MPARISAKRAKQLSRNPGTRTKVPTSMLSPKHRKMRLAARERAKRERELDDPAAVTRPLTPRLLEEQVGTQTALWAAPAERELKGQLDINSAMMGAIPAWYKEYIEARQAAVQHTRNAYAGAVGVQQNVAAGLGSMDAQQQAQQQAAMQADAQARGAQVDPQVAATAQQAALSRQAALGSQQALTAGLGAADVGYRANQVVVAGGQKARALEQEAGRGRAIRAQGMELAERKGQFATQTRQKLIDAEHTKQLENKAFGLNVAKAEADVQADAAALTQRERDSRRKSREARARLDVSRGQLDVARGQLAVAEQRANTYDRRQQAMGKPKMTAATRKTTVQTRDDIDYAVSMMRKLKDHKVTVKDKNGDPVLDSNGRPKKKPARLTPKQIREILETGRVGKRRVPRDIYNAALDIYANGYLSPANIAALRRRGVAIGALGYKTKNGRSRRRRRTADTGDILAGSRPAR